MSIDSPADAPAISHVEAGTESVDPRFVDLDRWSSLDAVRAMAEGQLAAAAVVHAASPAIASAVEAAQARLSAHPEGRFVYCGAGASGRLAVQDGVELVPTYGLAWDRLLFAVAGGEGALMRAVEDAEDNAEDGAAFAERHGVGPADVVIGVAASGRTPYTRALIRSARDRGALTIGLANNAGTPLLEEAEHPILLQTGPEPVAGSTRMKAGTAQKIALNLISTGVMVRLGGVYRGLMVGMLATNAKLRVRAARIVSQLAQCDEAQARAALKRAGGNLKVAILLAMGFDDPAEAGADLARHGGSLRRVLAALEA